MGYIKGFDLWNILKKAIDTMVFKSIPLIAGDVFLIRFGVNVGSEMDGKGESFLRPVIVIKVNGTRSFIGIPTTTKEKNLINHVPIKFNNSKNFAVLSQIRTFDTLRIIRFYGSISTEERLELSRRLVLYLFENEIPSFEGISHCPPVEAPIDKV